LNSIDEARGSDYHFFPAIKEEYDSSNLIFSIVIDCYYKLGLVKASIQSVLNQYYKNVELVIVDNGAQPDVSNYVNDIYLYEKNVTLIKFEKNQFSWNDTEKPVAICWNAGVLNSKGDIVAHLSYDDMLSKNCVEKMAKLFSDNKNCVTAGPLPVSIDLYGEVNKELSNKIESRNKRPRYIDGRKMAIDFITGSPKKYFASPGGVLFVKKDIISNTGGFDRASDLTQIIKFAIYGESGFDKEAKLYWRHHDGQLNKVGKKNGVVWCHILREVEKNESIVDSWSSLFSSKDVSMLKRYIRKQPVHDALSISIGYIRNKEFRAYLLNLYYIFYKCPIIFLYIVFYSPVEMIKIVIQKILQIFNK
jgi:glycosyltransferase involved in cell wall biosynthesis